MSYLEIDGKNMAETDNAILIYDGYESKGGDDREDCVWVPKSQMQEWPAKGQEGTFLIKEWIANKKGMI